MLAASAVSTLPTFTVLQRLLLARQRNIQPETDASRLMMAWQYTDNASQVLHVMTTQQAAAAATQKQGKQRRRGSCPLTYAQSRYQEKMYITPELTKA